MEVVILLPMVKMLTSLFFHVIQWVYCYHQIELGSFTYSIPSLSSTLCQVLNLSPYPLYFSASSLPILSFLSLVLAIFSSCSHAILIHLIQFYFCPYLFYCFFLLPLVFRLLIPGYSSCLPFFSSPNI